MPELPLPCFALLHTVPTMLRRRLNTGDRLRNSFGGGQANQLARAVSSYQRRFGIPDTPHEAVAASLGGDA